MGENAEKEASISAVCASGVDLVADSISWMKREVSASYTVEASFVMAVAFFFIAALLNGAVSYTHLRAHETSLHLV